MNILRFAYFAAAHKHEKSAAGSTQTTAPEIPVADTAVGDGAELPPEPKVNAETGEVTGIELGEVKLLKKLVAKDIVGRAGLIYRKEFANEDDKTANRHKPMEPRQLYVVFGQARSTKTGESDYGPWVAFLGTFEAVDLKTGDRYVSDKLHLQDPAEGLLLDQLARRADTSDSIQFLFEVGVKPSQKWIDTDNGNSYEFTIKTHFKLDKADPLAAMRQLASSVIPKRLTAPK
jgi:hypothetical protein